MITPVFQSKNNSAEHQNNKYHDPLNKGIFVVLSNSNEIGTAISDIAPRLGAALWAPTFMYLGADIYDKYKNDKDNYDPSAKRAFKRAIYQALTSVVAMPAAIILGKYIIFACLNFVFKLLKSPICIIFSSKTKALFSKIVKFSSHKKILSAFIKYI